MLGLVQGLTEFLPISSSAHLIIVPWLFGWDNRALNSIQFDVALHMGTLLAVLVYFAPDWRRLIAAFVRSVLERRIGSDPDRRLVWYIVFATVPAFLVGVLAESQIDEVFHDPNNLRGGLLIIAVMMIVMGALLLFAERIGKHDIDLKNITLGTALGIGVAQALALVPGVSRSGSTITTGLFLGLKREAAARFSFLLSTPIVLGAGLKKLCDMLQGTEAIPADQTGGFVIGFLAAAISGSYLAGFVCAVIVM